MEGAGEIAVAVEAVHLLVREAEARGGGNRQRAPHPHERTHERALAPRRGQEAHEQADQVARAQRRQHAQERQGRQVEPVPLHLVDADAHVEGHEGQRDDRHGGLLDAVLPAGEGKRRDHDERAAVVEEEHVAQRAQPHVPDLLAAAGLHVERVLHERAVIQVPERVAGHGHREDAGHVEQLRARDAPRADRVEHERQAHQDGHEVQLGPGHAGGAHDEARVEVVLAVARLVPVRRGGVHALARAPQHVRPPHGQERDERLLEARLRPEHEARRTGQPDGAPHEPQRAPVVLQPARHARREREGHDAERRAQHLADLEHVPAKRLERRHDEHPQEVREALDVLAPVEHQAVAGDQVVGVTPRDVRVVLDELEHDEDPRDERDGRQQVRREAHPARLARVLVLFLVLLLFLLLAVFAGVVPGRLAAHQREDGEARGHDGAPEPPAPRCPGALEAKRARRDLAHVLVRVPAHDVDPAHERAAVGRGRIDQRQAVAGLRVEEARVDVVAAGADVLVEGDLDVVLEGLRRPLRRGDRRIGVAVDAHGVDAARDSTRSGRRPCSWRRALDGPRSAAPARQTVPPSPRARPRTP